MENEFVRTEMLIGSESLEKLRNSRIAVFGIGGVGGHVAEALVRCGAGAIDIIDNDCVSVSNINRQIIALHSTIGKLKVDVAKQRFLDINPNLAVKTYPVFVDAQTLQMFDFSQYDYVVDAIDTVTSKLLIIEKAKMSNTPVISSMGTGNKLNPSLFEICDISKTSVCPLARVMRYELKKRGISKVDVLYSVEPPVKPKFDMEGTKQPPASCSFVPAVAGLMIAGHVVNNLIKNPT